MTETESGLYHDRHVAALDTALRGLLPLWGLAPDSALRLLNLSENATFLARDPAQPAPIVLRVHRPAYHSAQEIASELAWIGALRRDGTAPIPAPLATRDGALIHSFDDGQGPRHVTAFAFMTGREPDPDAALVPGFHRLGQLAARLHAQQRDWPRPAGFTRKTWDWQAAFGPAPLWGDWRAAPGLTADGRRTLETLALRLRDDLAAYGTGPDRFGLIHADLRLANLLVDGDRIGILDFDDCGFSWFLYDFAAAISFHETHPLVPDLQAAWCDGYRTQAPLPPEAERMLPVFVLFRRLLLTAWIASHAETDTARSTGLANYTAGTLALAERWLAQN